ncbi:MAG TPA: leucine-rich repeat domain-containing protein [Bryobacteraceae bacterium]|nr:leucine-rich repeat domain-containing protein [Bryobacteraceae bacterium]
MNYNFFVDTMTFAKRTILAISASLFAAAAWGQETLIPDPNLAAAIVKYAPNVKKGEPLTSAILESVIYLNVTKDAPVTTLAGLEKAKNLTTIFIDGSPITDLKPLQNLSKLEALTIRSGKIQDLSPLAGLVNLTYLDLAGNQISDLKPIAGLKKLEMLFLANNKIADIGSLAGLDALQTLHLDGNQIADVQALASLKKLSILSAKNNHIGDVSPLTALTDLRYVYLDGNQVSDLAPLVAMATKDDQGPKKFAPYWTISLNGDPLSADAKANELPQLRKHALDVMTGNR